MRIATLLLSLLLASMPAWADSPTRSLNDMDLTSLDGSALAKDVLDGKVTLFVNVASRCGLTPQYEGLQALYESRKDDGLVIVGVPCNQFGAQEPGGAEQIATFCTKNYGVTFPLLEKQPVNGPNRSPLYRFLVDEGPDPKDIEWNFAKFLLGRDGAIRQRFAPTIAPDAAELTDAIDAALKR